MMRLVCLCRPIRLGGWSDSSRWLVRPDNQCSQHLFYNRDLLSNVRRSEPLWFRGVGGRLKSDLVGDFLPLGITVYYSPEAPANLISMGKIVKSNDHVSGYTDDNKICWIMHKGDRFDFVLDDSNVWLRSFEPMESYVTVAEREAEYPVKDIVKARLARELQRRLGAAAPEAAVQLLVHSSNNTTGLHPKDFKVMKDVYGKSIPELKGKTTEPRDVRHESEPVRRPIANYGGFAIGHNVCSWRAVFIECCVRNRTDDSEFTWRRERLSRYEVLVVVLISSCWSSA